MVAAALDGLDQIVPAASAVDGLRDDVSGDARDEAVDARDDVGNRLDAVDDSIALAERAVEKRVEAPLVLGDACPRHGGVGCPLTACLNRRRSSR